MYPCLVLSTDISMTTLVSMMDNAPLHIPPSVFALSCCYQLVRN